MVENVECLVYFETFGFFGVLYIQAKHTIGNTVVLHIACSVTL